MPRNWSEILDHGSDPGRYTLIDGSGRVITANENGTVVFTRRCKNPYSLVAGLSREPGVRIVKPAHKDDLAKKIYQHFTNEFTNE